MHAGKRGDGVQGQKDGRPLNACGSGKRHRSAGGDEGEVAVPGGPSPAAGVDDPKAASFRGTLYSQRIYKRCDIYNRCVLEIISKFYTIQL